MKRTRKKATKILEAGSVVVCVNDTPATRKLRRIALKKGNAYIVLVHILTGMDKNGVVKNSVIVAQYDNATGNITHLSYPYVWDASRFKLVSKTNYFGKGVKTGLLNSEIRAKAEY